MYSEEDWKHCWETGHTPWRGPSADIPLLNLYTTYRDMLVQRPTGESPRALVPLCGDSPAVRFLYDAGFDVTGIDIVPEAITSLLAQSFADKPVETITSDISKTFRGDRLTLSVQDFFLHDRQPSFDLIYDRAALIALPRDRRVQYAELITTLLHPGGHLLLEVTAMSGRGDKGPPFSVDLAEVDRLYPHFARRARVTESAHTIPPPLAERGVTAITAHRLILGRDGDRRDTG